jgi:uncharacterized protein (TIGR02246 family)
VVAKVFDVPSLLTTLGSGGPRVLSIAQLKENLAARLSKEIAVRRIASLLICCAFVALFRVPFAETKSLESDLQGVLGRFTSAWDKSDSAGIAALFDEKADLVIPDGILIEGRGAIEKFYASVFERGYRGSRGTASIKHVREIGPDMAIVDGEWRIDGAIVDGRSEAPEIGIFNLVAKHRSRRWAICSLREQTSAQNLIRINDATSPAQTQQPKSGDDSDAAGDSPERNAIKELDQKDIAASKKNDVDALVALWTDDGVLLQPGAAAVVGKEAIRKLLLQQQQQAAHVETIAYDEKWNEVRIAGGYAFEWGQIGATLKLPDAREVRQSVNAIRVLAKQPDGSWRVARVAVTPAARP